jgi:hypothetical protein
MGLVHSMLARLDGSAGGPTLNLVARPHPDDKAYHQSLGEDWIEDGTVLNADVLLHELLYLPPRDAVKPPAQPEG